ncbi:MAG: proteasome assembly chaperone family protein [Thaumarchaeota archaeon]|nr:proteasome assembly chaperone family protein [Nitrososphaerota archaeon]
MTNHLFDTVVEFEKTEFHSPVVFGGFVGPGLVGLVSAGYMIEKLNLHEIAHVKSQHIPPVAVFVGAKLRHPFRIYSDDSGTVVVMICEMPIDIEGLYEISSVLLDWVDQIHGKEIVVLDGVGVSGMPDQRETFGVGNEDRMKELGQKGINPIRSALISGVGGSLLNQALTRRISGVSLLTTASTDFPDPGAALSMIKSINQIFGLAIETADLEQNVERLNQRLNDLAGEYKKQSDQLPNKGKEFYG